jgi:hypothetical protein
MSRWVALLLLALASLSTSIKVEYDLFESVPMKSTANLTLKVGFDESTDEEANWPRNREGMRGIWAQNAAWVELWYTFRKVM